MTTQKQLIITLLFLFYLFSNSNVYASDKMENVTLQLIWKNQFQFAGYYVAREKGFYNDAGLNVTIREYKSDTDITKEVISNKAQFGIGRSSLVLESMKGKPVYLLSAIFQHSPFMLLTRKRPDLEKVADLKGKRVMVTSDMIEMAALTAMLVSNGIKAEDYIAQKHTFSVDDLISGKTDAVSAYVSNEPYQMEKKGVDYRIFSPKDYGYDFYSDILFTSKDFFKKSPQLVDRFYRASIKGCEYAFSHIEETVEIILKKYNSQNRSKEALIYEANTLKKLAYDREIPLGNISRDRIERIAQVYQLLGFTRNPLKIDGFIYSPKANENIELTPKERSWLAEHPRIKVNGDEWPPFIIKGSNGEYRGISIDMIKKAAALVNLEIEIVPGEWDQMFKMLKENKLDLAIDIIKTKERSKILHFTEPYIATPNAIYVKQDNSQIKSINDLKGKTVPIVKGYYIEEILMNEFPDIKLVQVSSPLEGLKKVVSGEADAYIGALIVSQYILQKNLMSGFKIAAYFEQVPLSPSFGVRRDYPILANIMQKSLASISEIEKAHIIEKYISLNNVPPAANTLSFNENEKTWLKKHPKIRIGIMDDWPPMDFIDDNGKPNGIGVDYFNLLNKQLKGVLTIVPGPFDKNYALVKDKKLDALMDITPKKEREEFFHFTAPYLEIPHVFVGRTDGPYFQSGEELEGKVIALEKGFYNVRYFTDNYPEVIVKEYKDTSTALGAVSRGDADAYAGNRAVATYLIAKEIMSNLQIQGRMEKPPVTIAIGVRKDWPVLAGILDRALKNISEEEKYKIGKKWTLIKSDRDELTTLTREEKAWLKKHPVIKVHNEKDWPPFNYFEHGIPKGLSIEYMNLLAERLGLKIEYVTGPSRNDFLSMIKGKDLDVMLNIVRTEERQKYLLYTDPYFLNPNVIISSARNHFETIEELSGKTVAFPKGFFWEEVLSKSFPEINRMPVENSLESLKTVALGKADAALAEMAVANFLISENMLTGLRLSGKVNIGDPELIKLRIGIRNDWPLLQSSLVKAMADISPQEMTHLRQKWLMTEEDEASSSVSGEGELSIGRLVIYSIVVLIIISLLAWALLHLIKKENIAFSFGSKWFRVLVLSGLSVFVIIVILLGWFTLERNKKRTIENMNDFLTGILDISTERVQLWTEERKSFMKRLGRDPELVSITKRLLTVGTDSKSLLESEPLQEARKFFSDSENIFENIGFFIINPEYISIGSMRDTNVGTPNLIAGQYPEILKKAFQGQVSFVPPMTSDVKLEDGSAKNDKKPPTMFFIAPVQDYDGKILAVMTLRLSPWNDLSRVLNTSKILSSGETYAFDDNGRLLTTSRFEEQLRRIGLIAEDQKSSLNIEIRDPGSNMTEGYKPKLERSKQPLTLMASRALQLKQNVEQAGQIHPHSEIEINMKGYRDYRGVPVFGAWLWYTDMGFGLATEIDADEALSYYYMTKRTVFILLGFTLFLSVGAILLVLILGERTSKALMKARDQLEEKVEERTAELKEKQDRLTEAEERSRLLLDSAGEGIFGVDIDGRVNFINPSALKMLGFNEEDLLGKKVHSLIHHSKTDGSSYLQENCPMFKAYQEGTSHSVDDEVLWRKDGTFFHVEYLSTPIKKGANIKGAVITFRDITERKKMEDAITSEKERLQNILDTSPVGVSISIEGEIQFANSRFIEMFGIGIGDKTPELYVNPADREKLLDQLENEGKVDNFELQLYNSTRQVMEILSNYLAISYKDEKGILAWMMDITDRKTSEIELRRNFEELERFSKLTIDREEKMISLKEEINELLRETGNSPKYKIVQ